MTQTTLLITRANGTENEEYGALVNRLLRERYSLSEELSILRRREEAPALFAAYNDYAEECKRQARATLFGEEASV